MTNKAEVFANLDNIVDDDTLAFLSVTIRKDQYIIYHTTVTELGIQNIDHEARLHLSDALIRLAQHIRRQP